MSNKRYVFFAYFKCMLDCLHLVLLNHCITTVELLEHWLAELLEELLTVDADLLLFLLHDFAIKVLSFRAWSCSYRQASHGVIRFVYEWRAEVVTTPTRSRCAHWRRAPKTSTSHRSTPSGIRGFTPGC